MDYIWEEKEGKEREKVNVKVKVKEIFGGGK